MKAPINVLMCGSELSVGGGMISVILNYLKYTEWDDIHIIYVPTHTDANNIKKILFYGKACLEILRIVWGQRIDIAHLHTTFNGSFFRKGILMRFLRKFGVKVILHHHTDYTNFYAYLNKSRQRFVDRSFAMADMNIVLGENLISMITDKAPDAKVRAICNGVQLKEKNRYNQNGEYVMFLGWLIERKGIRDLLQAIQLLDTGIDEAVKFALCGNGGSEITDMVEELNISHRIIHIGWADDKKKAELFSKTFVNVLPSYWEGQPMTVLETMAYGIPNIASNISTVSEVIEDGENGFLIAPGDIESLADRIRLFWEKPELRKGMSDKAYKTICERFAISNHIKQIKALYNEMSNDQNNHK